MLASFTCLGPASPRNCAAASTIGMKPPIAPPGWPPDNWPPSVEIGKSPLNVRSRSATNFPPAQREEVRRLVVGRPPRLGRRHDVREAAVDHGDAVEQPHRVGKNARIH